MVVDIFPQACTEMIMPLCTNGGEDDIFESYPWNFESYAQYCEEKYEARPTTDLVEKEYGGKDLRAASNIIFRYNTYTYNTLAQLE